MQTFIIDCSWFDVNGKEFRGKPKVKDCNTELQAKIKLEAELKKKYPSFVRMVVHSCSLDNDLFNTLFGGFRR